MTHAHSQAQSPANTAAGADCAPTYPMPSARPEGQRHELVA